MKLFWKIFIASFIAFVVLVSSVSYVTATRHVSDMENHLLKETSFIASFVSREIEGGYLESRWPLDSLSRLSESHGFLFWWVLKKDGTIHLANEASFMGTNAYAYFPQVVSITGNENIFLDKNQNYGIFVVPLEMGKEKWLFWYSFSLTDISRIRQEIISLYILVSTTSLLLLGIIMYFIVRRFTRPVRDLAAGAEAIGKGDLSYRVKIEAKDELGQLASAFNQMVSDLRTTTTSIDNLNKEITKREQVEEELQKTVAELGRSNAELERFAYIASHDLQEPLRMVASYTQLLEKRYKDRLDADAHDFIGYAVDGAKRMQQLINDLLAYSRVGTRGKPFEPVDCMTVFEAAVANLDVTIRESDAEVTSDPLPTVMADEGQLVQLFQNLIDNAVKFHGEEPPRVHVSAEQSGDEWVFSVQDNGIGIDPQYLEQAFIVFQRLHGGKYRGTGIGLSIAKRIVERHGGRIWLESQSGKGTIVHFTIPAKGGKQS